MMARLAAWRFDLTTIMIDATFLEAHRMACSQRTKKAGTVARSVRKKN
ncbi:hypothetical protein [Paracoccus sp. Ld10]